MLNIWQLLRGWCLTLDMAQWWHICLACVSISHSTPEWKNPVEFQGILIEARTLGRNKTRKDDKEFLELSLNFIFQLDKKNWGISIGYMAMDAIFTVSLLKHVDHYPMSSFYLIVTMTGKPKERCLYSNLCSICTVLNKFWISSTC